MQNLKKATQAYVLWGALLCPFWAPSSALALPISRLECEADLNSRADLGNQDALYLAIHRPEFIQQMRARRRFAGDIDFEVPELKPLISQLDAELEELKRRVKRRSGTLNSIRKKIFALNYYSLKRRIASLRERPSYWPVIEVSAQFAKIVDQCLEIEGKLTWLEKHHGKSIDRYLADAKQMAKIFGAFWIPSFYEPSIAEMNEIWGQAILPIGLVRNEVEADGKSYAARTFYVHDIQHAQILAYGILRAIKFEHLFRSDNLSKKYAKIGPKEQSVIQDFISSRSQVLAKFMYEFDQIKEPLLREAITLTLFTQDHERGIFRIDELRRAEPYPLSLTGFDFTVFNNSSANNVEEALKNPVWDDAVSWIAAHWAR